MHRYTKKYLTFKSKKRDIPKFDPSSEEDTARLVKYEKHRFKYDRSYNAKYNKIKMSLRPVSVLNGQLGVFAEQRIKVSNRTIGWYTGKRVKVGKENAYSNYIFEIADNKNEPIEFLDGNKVRDWSNFINHSNTPNLDVAQRKIKGKWQICFYVIRPIKKGDQILFDYGSNYFHGIKNYYIHPSDGWERDVNQYQKFQHFYLPGTYVFDEDIMKGMELKSKEWICPEIFLSIYQNDVKQLKQKIKAGYPVDLPAYAVNKAHKMESVRHQEHVTAIMYASFLGRERCIEILMRARADVNRCMLTAGLLPFSLLCKGKGGHGVVERIGKKFLRKMHFPFMLDRDKKSILHYAIRAVQIDLIKIILRYIMEEDIELLSVMLPREDLIFCIEKGYFAILKQLFVAMHRCEVKKPRFHKKLWHSLSQKYADKLHALLDEF